MGQAAGGLRPMPSADWSIAQLPWCYPSKHLLFVELLRLYTLLSHRCHPHLPGH